MSHENQPTLFSLHECLSEAALQDFYRLPAPVLGRPASMAADGSIVEQALYDAADDDLRPQKKLPDENLMTASFIIDRETKAVLDAVCRSNGTTASAFLRQCARRLVAEYHGG